MKKFFVCALAALSFTACVNEDGLLSESKGYINLNVNTDNEMVVTRADNQTVTDLSKWYVTVSPETVGNTAAGSTTTTGQITANGLAAKSFKAGGYKIDVQSHTSEDAAYSGAGEAYYEGTTSQAIAKGTNTVTVSCGKAKNCRVKADISGLADFTQITDLKITASQDGRSDYDFTSTSTAYFYAVKDISYTIRYKYNGEDKSTNAKTISSPAAATEYQIIVKTNENGTIQLTITYDDVFADGTDENITIDAATGTEVTE